VILYHNQQPVLSSLCHIAKEVSTRSTVLYQSAYKTTKDHHVESGTHVVAEGNNDDDEEEEYEDSRTLQPHLSKTDFEMSW
jgi:hypothetical protein